MAKDLPDVDNLAVEVDQLREAILDLTEKVELLTSTGDVLFQAWDPKCGAESLYALIDGLQEALDETLARHLPSANGETSRPPQRRSATRSGTSASKRGTASRPAKSRAGKS